MVKRNNTNYSAGSVAKGSVVLSKAIEKSFAIEAQTSRLRHHVWVLSERLQLVTLKRRILEDLVRHGQCPNCSEKGEPLGDVVAEEGEEMYATKVVTDSWEEVRPAYEEVAEKVGEDDLQGVMAWFVGKGRVEPQVVEPVVEVDGRYNRFALDLVPDDQEESIQVPLILQSSLGNVVGKADSGSPEGKYEKIWTIFEEKSPG